MLIKIGFDIEFELAGPTPMVLMLYVHPSRQKDLLAEEKFRVEAERPAARFHRSLRQSLRASASRPVREYSFSARNLIEDSGQPDRAAIEAFRNIGLRICLTRSCVSLTSRYCEVDKLSDIAWKLFGDDRSRAGHARRRSAPGCITILLSIISTPTRPSLAFDCYQRGRGVCRDFSHLALTFCRCMNIPARYVTGYMGDIGVPLVLPMDFSGWFEGYLGGRWYTFDARHNVPRIGRIVMAVGRDAADVALTTNFGRAQS